MIKNNYIISSLLLIVGGILLMTGELIASIAGVVVAGIGTSILAGTLCYNRRKARLRKEALGDPCEIYEELDKDVKRYSLTINTHHEPQCINITLRFKTEVNLKFMYIYFEGEPAPQIERVYEWNMGIKYKDKNITTWKMPDGHWNWTYGSSLHKLPNTHIKIGIKCIAKNPGQNSLIVYLGCDEAGASKHLRMPIEITLGS